MAKYYHKILPGVIMGNYFFFGLFVFSAGGPAPVAYGGSQARGPIGAVAAGLHHSRSDARSEPRL